MLYLVLLTFFKNVLLHFASNCSRYGNSHKEYFLDYCRVLAFCGIISVQILILTTSFFEVKLEDDPLLAGAGGNDYAANCHGDDDDNASSNDHEDEDGSELFDETANQVTYLPVLTSLICFST